MKLLVILTVIAGASAALPVSCRMDSDCPISTACYGSTGTCGCLHGFIGSPWKEGGSCERNCTDQKCVDPCHDRCAANATCVITEHSAVCRCLPEYRGDPNYKCSPAIKGDCINYGEIQYGPLDTNNMDYASDISEPSACQTLCQANKECSAWNWSRGSHYCSFVLEKNYRTIIDKGEFRVFSGPKFCPGQDPANYAKCVIVENETPYSIVATVNYQDQHQRHKLMRPDTEYQFKEVFDTEPGTTYKTALPVSSLSVIGEQPGFNEVATPINVLGVVNCVKMEVSLDTSGKLQVKEDEVEYDDDGNVVVDDDDDDDE